MKKTTKRLLSFLLVFVMMFSILPTTAFAAGEEKPEEITLQLGDEYGFELKDSDDEISFRFTAKEAGTYIFYFRHLTSNPISISWNKENIEYYHDPANGHFEGRVVELEKDEEFTVWFGVSEGFDPYGAIAGVTTISKEFKDFYTNMPIDHKNRLFDVGIGQRTAQVEFFAEDRFCYGVEWSAVSADPEIVSINEDESIRTGVSYRPFFDLNNVGETTVTIRADFAGATVEKTYFVKVREGGGDEGGHPEDSYFKPFKNLEELKSFIREHNGEEQAFFYEGEGALVIDEDLDFPRRTRLEADQQPIIIDSGVTVNVDRLHCRNLEVRGNLTARENMGVREKLEISGEVLLLENFLDMEYPAVISGLEHMNFREEYQRIVMNVRYDSAERLADLIDDVAENGYKDRKVQHIYRFEKENTDIREIDLVIDRDLTIAQNDRLELFEFKSVTIAKGKTLTVEEESSVGISSPVTVNGVLVNNGSVDVSYYENGKLILTDDKAYSGTGELHIHCFNPEDFDKCFIPKTKDDFDSSYDVSEDDGCYHYNVRYVAGLIKLGTPYDLTWGTHWLEEMEYDEVNDQLIITGYSQIPKAGFTSWKTKRPDQAQAQVKIYRKGEKTPCHECWYGFGEEVVPEIRSVDLFLESDLGSGTYYFTVQSMGDYITYRNSDIAVSGYYTYTQPNQQLTACSDLQWFDKNDIFVSWLKWNSAEPSAYVDGYQVMFYYSETENGEYEQFGGLGGRNGNPMFSEEPFHDHFLQERGEGYYKFKVRSLSKDITKYQNGEWSELSPVLDMKKIPQDVTNDLDHLLNQNLPAQDVIDQVQAMDTVDLKKTLLTDQENNGATEVLRQLENQVGGPANVVVTQDAAAFNGNQISIVGANLNNKDDDAEAITLEIDKPEKQHVIDELYDSSVAVRFSMTLTNVEDPKNLDVPVKITLPVPDSIHPDFLVILHYHVDGSHEIIYPFIHEMNGMWYADFVLTSFSDFVLTERIVPEIPTEDVSDVFPDVKDGAWYEEGVQFVYDNGLMSGSNGLFNPTSDITRAQLVTTLYRLAGEPRVTDKSALAEFSDVAEGKYYTDAVCWAYAEGIATGNNGKFDPTGKLTRQQMAAFFFRLAEYAEFDTEVRGDISGMLNADKVSGYAKEPVEWAVGTGLISGSDVTDANGNKVKDLNPRGNTTRAQVATILMRFCE